MADARRFKALSMVPPLADEVARQIEAAAEGGEGTRQIAEEALAEALEAQNPPYAPYDSYATFIADNIPSSVDTVSALSGDVLLSWVRDPAGTIGPTSDGGMWAPATDPTPMHWGAVGDGATDDTVPVHAMLDWMGTDETSATKEMDGHGRTFALGSPYTINGGWFWILKNASFVAIPGTWAPGDYMFTGTGGSRAFKFQNVQIDCAFLVDGGVLNNGCRGMIVDVMDIVHFTTYGFNCDNGPIPKIFRLNASRWRGSDSMADIADESKRIGVGIRSATADAVFLQCSAAWCGVPLQIDAGCHHNRFIGCHFFNGAGNGLAIHTDPVDIQIMQGSSKNALIGTYIDNGYVDMYSTDVTIIGTQYLYNPARATMTSHVRLHAVKVNDNLNALIYSNNSHSGAFNDFQFIEEGGNTWETNPLVETINKGSTFSEGAQTFVRGDNATSQVARFMSSHDNCTVRFQGLNTTFGAEVGGNVNDLILRTSGATRMRIFEAGGTQNINGFTNTGGLSTDTLTATGATTITGPAAIKNQNVVGVFDVDSTMGDAQAGSLYFVQQGAFAVTHTLPDSLPKGWWVDIAVKGSGAVTLQAAPAASLNGVVGGSAVIPQGKCVKVICARNTNDASAEYYVIGL